VPCRILNGAFQIVPDSGDVVATPGPMPGPEAVQSLPGLRRESVDLANAVVRHTNPAWSGREHRRAVYRLMRVVHGINRKPLTARAHEFEGVM